MYRRQVFNTLTVHNECQGSLCLGDTGSSPYVLPPGCEMTHPLIGTPRRYCTFLGNYITVYESKRASITQRIQYLSVSTYSKYTKTYHNYPPLVLPPFYSTAIETFARFSFRSNYSHCFSAFILSVLLLLYLQRSWRKINVLLYMFANLGFFFISRKTVFQIDLHIATNSMRILNKKGTFQSANSLKSAHGLFLRKSTNYQYRKISEEGL